MGSHERGSVRAEAFTGVYCSGMIIDDPSLLTAMCLLFDRIYLPNFITDPSAYVNRVTWMPEKGAWKAAWSRGDYRGIKLGGQFDIHFAEQLDRITLEYGEEFTNEWFGYLVLVVASFFMRNEALLGSVLDTSFYQTGIRGGHPSIYFDMTEDSNEALQAHIQNGAIPVLNPEQGSLLADVSRSQLSPSSYIASVLALNAVQLALPLTHEAHAEDILEAREKLRDQLLPFWASMLRLSKQFKEWQRQEMPDVEIEAACVEFLNIHVRPDLLDLNAKLLKEHRNWAYKVIHPVVDGVEAAVSKANLSTADLVALALQTVSKIASTFKGSHARSPTLAYLIRVKQVMSGHGHR